MNNKWVLPAVVSGILLLAVTLYFSGRNTSIADSKGSNALNNANKKQSTGAEFDYEGIEKEALLALNKDTAQLLSKLKGKTVGRGPMANPYLDLASMWDTLNNAALAAYYYRQSAEQDQNIKTWTLAGQQYFQAMSQVSNPEQNAQTMLYLSGKSKEAFGKVMAKEPNNYAAKTELAAVYIYTAPYNTSENEVMTGVGMLKEIEAKDSTYRRAVYLLGMLSMQSQQYPKAKERFLKLTNMKATGDPEYPFYFRYLGQAYEAMDNHELATEAYKKYKALVVGKKVMTEDADALLAKLKEHAKHK
ncbi:MAG: hypothetical protein SGJ04_09800 [Bacteroidota bacterium]|nr:hypothetical protein [Bacteroidota bacterium]